MNIQTALLELDDDALSNACISPVIDLYKEHQAQNPDLIEQLFLRLTKGQLALFAYRSLYNHARNSLSEFYWWSAYYYAQPDRWRGLLRSLQFWGESAMLHAIGEVEQELQGRGYSRTLEGFNVYEADLEQDAELRAAFSSLQQKFNLASPLILASIGAYIRLHPEEFMKPQDSSTV